MGDYHDLYFKINILLLLEVFENFIDTCLEYYQLDFCHCFSSPELSCDAMLKMTGIELELISDIDMYLFVEKGRDANNLCGCAMSKYFLYSRFNWLKWSKNYNFDVNSISEYSSDGYI